MSEIYKELVQFEQRWSNVTSAISNWMKVLILITKFYEDDIRLLCNRNIHEICINIACVTLDYFVDYHISLWILILWSCPPCFELLSSLTEAIFSNWIVFGIGVSSLTRSWSKIWFQSFMTVTLDWHFDAFYFVLGHQLDCYSLPLKSSYIYSICWIEIFKVSVWDSITALSHQQWCHFKKTFTGIKFPYHFCFCMILFQNLKTVSQIPIENYVIYSSTWK